MRDNRVSVMQPATTWIECELPVDRQRFARRGVHYRSTSFNSVDSSFTLSAVDPDESLSSAASHTTDQGEMDATFPQNTEEGQFVCSLRKDPVTASRATSLAEFGYTSTARMAIENTSPVQDMWFNGIREMVCGRCTLQ